MRMACGAYATPKLFDSKSKECIKQYDEMWNECIYIPYQRSQQLQRQQIILSYLDSQLCEFSGTPSFPAMLCLTMHIILVQFHVILTI